MSIVSTSAHWFLAQTKPNADQIACRHLERQGFRTFQPLERRTTARAGQFRTVLRPFFPGYVFLMLPGAVARWSVVNSTTGVTRLVSFAGKPAEVPHSIVEELQKACDEDNVINFAPGLVCGAEVEIKDGSFTGFLGRIERMTPGERALVLIEFMGKDTRVELTRCSLTRSGGSSGKLAGIAR